MILDLDTYQSFIEDLKQKLSRDLPGIKAHLKMAPPQRFSNDKPLTPAPDARTACILLLLYLDGEDIKFPLIVRPKTANTHSGQVAFPGGRYEEEDNDFFTTALRETEEEIGVKIDENQVLGKLSEIYIPPSNYLVYPIVAFSKEKPKFKKNEREVAEILCIKLNDLENADNHKIKETIWHNQKVELPYYELENNTVWGATAMILAEFLEIL